METSHIIRLLQDLIRIPSFSREEEGTADHLAEFLSDNNVVFERKLNNLWARNKYFDSRKPTILLNSHHDTVKPAESYSRDPFDPTIDGDKLFGLGSNDAGAALVSLLGVFLDNYSKRDLPSNIVLAATAEEEISGKGGIECLIGEIGDIDIAIVGEPTSMEMAVAEKGLLVLDCKYYGKAGHAGRDEGVNAIYKTIDDLQWFRSYEFEKVSSLLGPVSMKVTQIKAGKNHNVVPDLCEIVVDVRCTDAYTLEEVIEEVKSNTQGEIVPRSVRLRPSSISENHPIVKTGIGLGIKTYGSPTLSDQALMPFPSIKIGPGDSARSHTADEYVYLHEIESATRIYSSLVLDTNLSKQTD